MPKVSVVIPVYNVEPYIERCARSLFEQTLDDIEYIFVNDCTPDRSMEILESVLSQYPHRQSQVTIINNAENLKQAGARTVGMKAATGDYMIHCDPDDWVERDMYETMYQKAVETDADIVTCGVIATRSTGIHREQLAYKDSGSATLQSLSFSFALYDKLIRTSIIRDYAIFPFEGIDYSEDLNVTVRALFFADKVDSVINYFPYHYNATNPTAITRTDGEILFDKYCKSCIERLSEFLEVAGEKKYSLTCGFLKFYAKSLLLNSNKTRKWRETWPECLADIDNFPFPEKYKRRMAWLAKHPIMLAIYNRYFLWRYKYHNI